MRKVTSISFKNYAKLVEGLSDAMDNQIIAVPTRNFVWQCEGLEELSIVK